VGPSGHAGNLIAPGFDPGTSSPQSVAIPTELQGILRSIQLRSDIRCFIGNTLERRKWWNEYCPSVTKFSVLSPQAVLTLEGAVRKHHKLTQRFPHFLGSRRPSASVIFCVATSPKEIHNTSVLKYLWPNYVITVCPNNLVPILHNIFRSSITTTPHMIQSLCRSLNNVVKQLLHGAESFLRS